MKVWDLHCDTLSELRKAEKAGQPKSFAHNDLHIDLEKLQQGDYMLQCFAAFVNLGDQTPGADPLVTALEEIDQFKRIISAKTPRPGRSAACSPSKKVPAARGALACCAACTSWVCA